MNTPILTVTAINLFSVRSCAGESLLEATVTPNGLTFDRQWRLASSDGKFLTQRECPKMAHLQPSIVEGRLHLRFVGSSTAAPQCQDNLAVTAVNIYENWLGIDQGDEVAVWLTAVLGVEARLLRVEPGAATAEATNSAGILATAAAGDNDFPRPEMAPVLVISEESLADLNTRLQEPVLMNRFRPNIVVRGGRPYDEDSWTRVVIGDVVYVASPDPCGRCIMINVDQEKGEKSGREPLKTLAGYRRDLAARAVTFGKYMVPETSGIVRVGDKISNI